MKIAGSQSRSRPLMTFQSGGSPTGPSGQAWTAFGSNGPGSAAWASNVGILSSNGSNALLGPYVNLAAGSNMLFTLDSGPIGSAFPSNTLRVHSGIKATGQAYTVTNLTTDRSYNADSTSTAELADVLGTLISDLRAAGLIT